LYAQVQYPSKGSAIDRVPMSAVTLLSIWGTQVPTEALPSNRREGLLAGIYVPQMQSSVTATMAHLARSTVFDCPT